ncbi:MAG: hypothetical protein QOJ79_2153 [Actinomycetota bacterium]|nr:hypothetical protein [Actinomycetota bacterium]
MGSGLILLVIVGAWLAVLVPMALRSHDSASSLSSVDRFNDAMRVLSRREQTGRAGARSLVMPARPEASTPERPTVPIAVRRRRVLVTLSVLSIVTLVVGLAGSTWAVALFVVFAALTASYVVHLRRLALRKLERAYRQQMRSHGGTRTGAGLPRRVVGVPDRMPARPAALGAPLPAAAVRYEDPHPVAAAAASTWDAVEFPVPTYVNKPLAPPRPQRVLDLTRPGEWSAAMESEDVGLSILDDDDELDDILDGRRASGDW